MYNKTKELKRLKRNSYAKINLSLDVTGVQDDGYHQLCMVMHSIDLCDTIIITNTDTQKIEIKTNLPYLPVDKRNHAFQAAYRFFEKTGIQNNGIKIEIEKRIPVCAGLAGGSSNAATVLKGLNELYDAPLSLEELCLIGKKIGADVPYCLHGTTMLAEGIGEQLSPLPSLPKMPIVLAKPPFGVSTPAVFSEWDCRENHFHPDTLAMQQAIKNQDKKAIGNLLGNALEDPAFALIEKQGHSNPIPEFKACMLRHGALGALMSGSGPTVFGLFSIEQQATQAAKELSSMSADVFVSTT